MEELQKIYERRFSQEIDFRRKLYHVLCSDFFQAYVPRDSVVLDVAAGYCEFINHIEARKKIALDLNPDVQKFKNPDVQAIVSGSTDMGAIAEGSIDVAFTSNFFEHLTRPDIVKTICEVRRVLKAGGSFLILQPNYRYCYRDYWMFFDHVTALDDRSLSEVLEVNGFRVVECRPRFLPYTTKSRLPRSIFLVKVYLRMPFAHRFFGQQAFVVAKKAE